MVGRGKTPQMYGKDAYITDKYMFDSGIHYPFYWWSESAIKNQQSGHLNEILKLYNDARHQYDFYVPHKSYEYRYSHLHFFNNRTC